MQLMGAFISTLIGLWFSNKEYKVVMVSGAVLLTSAET